MIDPDSHRRLRREIVERMKADSVLLDELREEVRPLQSKTRRIQPRSATSISLVGADGGDNRLQFDPFLVQLIRVVDSSNNEYCLEAVTPTTSTSDLSAKQLTGVDGPTALGRMMKFLGVKELADLSPMIRRDNDPRPPSPSWVQVYREITEWAILFSIVRDKDFGTDTLIVFDGLLRSKVFARDLFARYRQGITEGIEHQLRRNRRQIYLVGVAKRSKVLDRYRLAMALESTLASEYPAFVEIPQELEEKAYIWSEYARADDEQFRGTEINKYVGGKMFFVKFGSHKRDPIWPVDIFLSQASPATAQVIMGYLLSDAVDGFPVPFYPRCLQRAHENASLVDFDLDILQDEVFRGIRMALGNNAPVLDAFQLQDADPAQARYR